MSDGDQIELKANIHREGGMYWAEVRSHPGLFASGETMDELIEALGEAWLLYTDRARTPGGEPRAAAQSVSVLVPV